MSTVSFRRTLIVLTTAAALSIAFGFVACRADAAYTAKVSQNALSIVGDAASDKLVLRLKPAAPNILQVDVGADGSPNFSFDRSTFTAIIVHAGAGDDVVRVGEGNGPFTDTEKTTVFGENGNDALFGGSFVEKLRGDGDADTIDGGAGDDDVLLGGGNDVFVWNPGLDFDKVDGGDGVDELRVRGTDHNDGLSIGVVSGKLRIARTTDLVETFLDAGRVERVQTRTFGGQDSISVGDLTGAGATNLDVDLSASSGTRGDGVSDLVLVNGPWSSGSTAQVSAFSGRVTVSGLVPNVTVSHSEPGLDQLDVHGGSGSDTFKGGNGIGALIRLELVGNGGEDALIGGDGAEILAGGDGGDFLQGNAGDDILAGGAQNDFLDGGPGADFFDCGDGGSIDTVLSDSFDTFAADCF